MLMMIFYQLDVLYKFPIISCLGNHISAAQRVHMVYLHNDCSAPPKFHAIDQFRSGNTHLFVQDDR